MINDSREILFQNCIYHFLIVIFTANSSETNLHVKEIKKYIHIHINIHERAWGEQGAIHDRRPGFSPREILTTARHVAQKPDTWS